MNTRNLKLGYVTMTLLNNSHASAYIRDYELVDDVPHARTCVNGAFVNATWNGTNWAEVAPKKFTYRSEDDGQLHEARHGDWNRIFE